MQDVHHGHTDVSSKIEPGAPASAGPVKSAHLSPSRHVVHSGDVTRIYLSEIGRRGGRASRRRLSTESARDMVRVREAQRAFRELHAQCFWSEDPDYRVTLADVPWVAERSSVE